MQRLGARLLRLLAVLAMVQVLAVTPWVSPAPAAQVLDVPTLARVSPAAIPAEQIDDLLAVRVQALQHKDRQGWLRTVEPALRGQQRELFDSLIRLPLADLALTRSGTTRSADRSGASAWTVDVVFRYRLAGWDVRPVAATRTQGFVVRRGRWVLSEDAPAAGSAIAEVWDSGPVVAIQSGPALVLGHPRDLSALRTVARAAAQAVPRVTAVWGPLWQRRVVVLVPSSQPELRRLLGEAGVTSQIAAFATSRAPGVGERIVVNPSTFPLLGSIGRRVVLTHETAHLAARAATGPALPMWLVEGFADYVGYTGLSLPDRVSAHELRAEVRRGELPAALPADGDFAGGNPRLAAIYEQSWLAVRLLVDRHGPSAVLRLYRAVGAGEDIDGAMQRILGTDVRSFTAAWQGDLRSRLS